MKTGTAATAALLFAFGASIAAAQEGEPEDDELTPAQAMELLGEAHGSMEKAEEHLNDSSRGKALETERKLIEKLERELRDEKGILAKVGKLVEKAEKKEKDAAEKLAEVIKKAKSSSGPGSQASKQQQKQQARKAKQPGSAAVKPYNPNRTDEPSKFKSSATRSGSWGNLPAAARAAMLAASKDELPPEFQEIWKKYTEGMQESPR